MHWYVYQADDFPAVCMDAVAQCRMLGGAIGLAICTNVLNYHVTSISSDILSPPNLTMLRESYAAIALLKPSTQAVVKQAYAEVFNE